MKIRIYRIDVEKRIVKGREEKSETFPLLAWELDIIPKSYTFFSFKENPPTGERLGERDVAAMYFY